MAKATAPYLHPRLASVEAKIAIKGHEDALDDLEALPPGQNSTLPGGVFPK